MMRTSERHGMWRKLWHEQLDLAGPAFLEMVRGEAPWDPSLTLSAVGAAALVDASSSAGMEAGELADVGPDRSENLAALAVDVVLTATGRGRELVERALDALDLESVRFVAAPLAQGEPEDGLGITLELAALAAATDAARAARLGARLEAVLDQARRELRALTPPLDAPMEPDEDLLGRRAEDDAPLTDLQRRLLAEDEALEQLAEVSGLARSLPINPRHPVMAWLRALEATLQADLAFAEAPLDRRFEAYARELAAEDSPLPSFAELREELEARLPGWVRARDWLRQGAERLHAWLDDVTEVVGMPLPVAAADGEASEGLTERVLLGTVRGGELSLVARPQELVLEWLGAEAPVAVYIPGDEGRRELKPQRGPLSTHGASYWALRLPDRPQMPPRVVLRFADGGEKEVMA